MNAKTLAISFSTLLVAVSATVVADDKKIDEVVSFASKSEVETVSITSDAIDVSDAMVSVKVAAVSVSSPAKPTLAAPTLVKANDTTVATPEAVARNN